MVNCPIEAMDKGDNNDNLWFARRAIRPKRKLKLLLKIDKVQCRYQKGIRYIMKSTSPILLKKLKSQVSTADVKNKDGSAS